jgi:hypothetical protein
MRSCPKAEALCEAKARHRLVKTGPIDAKRAQKANWSDPSMLAKLANAYAVAGSDDEKGCAHPRGWVLAWPGLRGGGI